MISRHKKSLMYAGAALLSCGCVAHAVAQTYPSKAIRVLVGFAAGGGTDTAARMVAQELSESLGQTVVVENRGGSGGIIAMRDGGQGGARQMGQGHEGGRDRAAVKIGC